MMLEWIVAVFSIGVAVIFNAEMDRIQHKPEHALFSNDWWLGRNQAEPGWLTKYPLSFISNGWHFCKSAMVFVLCNGYGYYMKNKWAPVILYIVFGVLFNSLYHRKYKKRIG